MDTVEIVAISLVVLSVLISAVLLRRIHRMDRKRHEENREDCWLYAADVEAGICHEDALARLCERVGARQPRRDTSA